MIAKIKVTGIVQGIGFRPFIYRIAKQNELTGYVRNAGDAGVDIVIEGTKKNIKKFLDALETNNPPLAYLDTIQVKYEETSPSFSSFKIKTSETTKSTKGSVIPPDVAICDDCLQEMKNAEDRRHDYFFTTCTNCGPRYTTISALPYDRERTSMNEFAMCNECSKEYSDPMDRRFHAQTIACPKCGPKAFITDQNGVEIQQQKSANAIRYAGKLLANGKIIAVKGYGGFHVACSAADDDVIKQIRKIWNRPEQPFALMTPDCDTAQKFARIGSKEKKLLESHIKPIVLLNKKSCYADYISPLVAPNLHNVGVMLPYTGLHHLLFSDANSIAFVMTSANQPGEPMIIKNNDAINKLQSVADYFLFYNRKIVQRCDDSVIRMISNIPTLLRRSRGYAPAPIHLKFNSRKCVLALGPELDVTSTVLIGNKGFLSQHIGNTTKLETLSFLRQASEHLLGLTNVKPEVIACDLHPDFETTRLAQRLNEEKNIPVKQVQHHHAHLAKLIGEHFDHPEEEIIGIAADGFGYGLNAEMWGGEILRGSCVDFTRLYHLEKQPLVGGDLSAKNPLRMLAGILYNSVDGIEDFLFSKSDYFPYGKKEVEIMLEQLKKEDFLKTSSCGRLLDAVSALLGICYRRTYEGEPAMKLESAAIGGKDVLELKPSFENGVINTTCLLEAIWKKRSQHSQQDLAYSAHRYIAECFAKAAIEAADSNGINYIGFSGGCAYNTILVKQIKEEVTSSGFTFLQHAQLPPGDGGVSLGQALVAANTA